MNFNLETLQNNFRKYFAIKAVVAYADQTGQPSLVGNIEERALELYNSTPQFKVSIDKKVAEIMYIVSNHIEGGGA